MNIFAFIIIIYAIIIKTFAQDGDYCQVDCGSNSHTACQSGSNKCDVTCKDENDGYTPMTDDQRLEVLHVHNTLREKVASGNEKKGDLDGVTTENMDILSWSYEAEYISACLAKRCKFEHDACRDLLNGTYCGQNLASEGSSNSKVKEKWKKADGFNPRIESWYSEVKDCKSEYYDSYPEKTDEPIGHFTQVIWALTNRVGCAYFVHKSDDMTKMMLVCNYFPGGNMISYPVFKRGEKGPDCGKDSRYEHLCGEQAPLRGNNIFSHLQTCMNMAILYFFKLIIF